MRPWRSHAARTRALPIGPSARTLRKDSERSEAPERPDTQTLRSIRALSIGALLSIGAVLAIGSGCKGDAGGSLDPQAAAAQDKLSADEEKLLERRDALLDSRRALREKRAALVEERRRLVASGDDTSEVDKQVDDLASEESKLGSAEDELDRDLEKLRDEQRAFLDQLGASQGETARVAVREAGVASREKSLAGRERTLAEREALLAERERKLAVRERDTCARGPATIIQAPPAGTRYSKRDVSPLLERARRTMNKRGILRSDLPAASQGLETEATKAMASGDYGQAYFAASQLAASVAAVQIDKTFIQGKIDRLNSKMKDARPDGSTQKDVAELFRKATADYGDGKFDRANRQLNTIYSLLDKRG